MPVGKKNNNTPLPSNPLWAQIHPADGDVAAAAADQLHQVGQKIVDIQ